jgi:hypothetical protein
MRIKLMRSLDVLNMRSNETSPPPLEVKTAAILAILFTDTVRWPKARRGAVVGTEHVPS